MKPFSFRSGNDGHCSIELHLSSRAEGLGTNSSLTAGDNTPKRLKGSGAKQVPGLT